MVIRKSYVDLEMLERCAAIARGTRAVRNRLGKVAFFLCDRKVHLTN